MSEPPALLVERRGDVRRIVLNRPHRRNAIDPDLCAALDAAVGEAAADPDTAVIVIAGTGTSFCAGADLRYLERVAAAGGDPARFLARVSACFSRIEQAPQPVVAALHGHAVAGGLELALACDVVVAAAGTLVGDGHVRNGLVPAGGASVRLPRKVGEPMARWLMLSGELVPIERLTGTGFVTAVAPAGRLGAVVAQVVDRLRTVAGPAQRRAKQLLAELAVTPAEQALDHELAAFAAHWASADVAGPLGRFVHGA